MRDSLNIGSCPHGEECVPTNNKILYGKAQREECRAFIEALRIMNGPEPEGARLYIKSNPHDFGTYYEVECAYDDEIEEAVEYAFKCEDCDLEKWEEVGISTRISVVNGEYVFEWQQWPKFKPGDQVTLAGYKDKGEIEYLGPNGMVLVNDGADWPTPPVMEGPFSLRDSSTLTKV